MPLPVTKAHAYGNDFLYVPRADAPSDDSARAALARRMCDRHTGLGGDGFVLWARTPDGARMWLMNADGSRAEVSGNGVRGLAAILARHDRAATGGAGRARSPLVIDTDAGQKTLDLIEAEHERRFLFRAAMGTPSGVRELDLEAGGETLRTVQLWMGNPQVVLLGQPLDEQRLARLGAALQHHPACPAGTNFEMAEIVTPAEVRILIYERGVGPTSSSGTGSCAAAVAAAAFGGAARDVQVIAPGGAQRVEWRDESVYLTGWAEIVFEGTWLA